MTPIIEIKGLVKDFGPIRAVDGISLSVDEGTIFGFLGPNGAGKTTTINILCTLLSPTSGTAMLGGYDCVREPEKVRREIGIVFQDTTLDKDLTAYENLSFHAYLYNVPRREIKARVGDALEFVGLSDRKDDAVKKFSGGMKRRLEVARGLIHRPRVLFLDEPTLGLDPQSRANLWEFVTELPRKHNMTVFMTTHYMDEAEVCDRIAIIDAGKIIAEGSPDELKKGAGGEVLFIESRDNDKAEFILKERLGLSAVRKNGGLSLPFTAEAVSETVKALGEDIISLRVERPSLNDVFLRLTGKAIRDEEASDGSTIREKIREVRRRHGGGRT